MQSRTNGENEVLVSTLYNLCFNAIDFFKITSNIVCRLDMRAFALALCAVPRRKAARCIRVGRISEASCAFVKAPGIVGFKADDAFGLCALRNPPLAERHRHGAVAIRARPKRPSSGASRHLLPAARGEGNASWAGSPSP